MTRKTALLILLIILIVSGGIFVYFSFFNNTTNKDRINDSNEDPFGSFFPTQNPSDDTYYDGENPEEYFNNNQNIPKLRKITSTPTSGFVSFDREVIEKQSVTDENGEETEKETSRVDKVFRFVERSTGNIYETLSTTLSLRRITNTSIPKVYNAVFNTSGDKLALETLDEYDTKKTFLGEIKESITGEGEEKEISTLEGSFLPLDSFNVSILGDSKVLYSNIQQDQKYNDITFFYTQDFLNKNSAKNFYSSLLSEWSSSWINENTISLLTKPSNISFGHLYEVNTTTGSFTKILGEKIGLNSLSNEKYVIYSEREGGRNFLNSYNKETRENIRISLVTLPQEKCVFSTQNEKIVYCATISNNPTNLPDSWYKGLVRTVDDFYKIDMSTGSTSLISFTSGDAQELIDVSKIKISPNDEFLIFINKRDLSLWSLDID